MSRRRDRTGFGPLGSTLLWLAPALAMIALSLSDPHWIERRRNLVFDEYQDLAPRPWSPDLPVRILDIDDASLARHGQWPWPRSRMAEITARLTEMGAAVVAFDIIYAEPDRSSPERVIAGLPDSPERRALAATLAPENSHDMRFRRAIAGAPAILSTAVSQGGEAKAPPVRAVFAQEGGDPRRFAPAFDRVVLPLPVLAEAATGFGLINFMPERDLVMRSAPLVALYAGPGAPPGGLLAPSLAAEALRVARGVAEIGLTVPAGLFASGIAAARIGDSVTPTNPDGSARIRFAGQQEGRYIPAWRLLAGDVARSEIEGRIILVGTSAAGLSDPRATPLSGSVPGVEIHAELIEHVVTGQRLSRPVWAPWLEAVLALAGAALAAFIPRRLRPLSGVLATFGLIGGAIIGSFLLFRHGDVLIDPLAPSAAILLAGASVTVALYRRSDSERRFVRDAFSRYLAPDIVRRIASDPSQVALGGELREVTILFCDVRDFTARSEAMDARGVVDFLNRVHTPLTAIVLEEGGTIDKYLGDGMMAFWNAPLDNPDHAASACRAALRIQAEIPKIDAALRAEAERARRKHVPLRVGVGINTGEVFVGNLGSAQRFDYSIVGDAVNVAARLEAATKEIGAAIAVSAKTAAQAQSIRFGRVGSVQLRGKSEALDVFTPLA